MTVKEGIAQGCPLSPALFSLALHDPLQKAAQETDVHPTAYIDDVRATAPVAKLEQFLTSLNTHLTPTGLQIATHKSTLFIPKPLDNDTINNINRDHPSLATLQKTSATVYLGAIFGPDDDLLKDKVTQFQHAANAISQLAAHNPQAAHILVKRSLTARGHDLARTHAPTVIQPALAAMESAIISTAAHIADVLHPTATSVATVPHCKTLMMLPTSMGGLGLKSPAQTANSAFIAATAATIAYCTTASHTDKTAKKYLDILKDTANPTPYTTHISSTLQTLHDKAPEIPADIESLITNATTIKQKQLTTTANKPHYDDLINQLPADIRQLAKQNADRLSHAAWTNPEKAPRANKQVFTIALRNRLLAPDIDWPEYCACSLSHPSLHHVLTCQKLSIFSNRHNRCCAEVVQALRCGGYSIRHTELTLNEFTPTDNQKRLDIVTQKGNKIVGLDFTCVSTTDLAHTETLKRNKYRLECQDLRLDFQPIAIHITGAAGPTTAPFLDSLFRDMRIGHHPHCPPDPRTHLSAAFQFAQARALIECRNKMSLRLAARNHH